MAEVLVSAVVETVLGLLSSAALDEIGVVWGLKDELNRLESTFVAVQLVLQDAEVKQRKNGVIQDWLRKLKNAAYDAENILDKIATEGLRRRADSERGTKHKVKSFLSRKNPLMFRLKMAREVRDVRGRLDFIAEQRHKFHLGEGVMENRFGETSENRVTSSLVNESEIYGRSEEKEMIMEKLFNGMCDMDDLSAYAIWGMGGLGKTTLAQMVYNDERALMHFELRIWVCISDDFSMERILKAIIESVEGDGCNISNLDPLERRVQEMLRGRFLLVLDDVWNEDHTLWDRLKEVLRCGSKGSVLMVTTRIEKVALMMANIGIHRIGFLSQGDSWSLFSRRAFPSEEGEENFVEIGKAIVKKCGGVPLAIKALGSMMRFKSHKSEWLAIEKSEIWQLTDEENGIFPALRLSYDNLLPQMRRCFAYCCVFPKDYFMEKDLLIQLWMANGFIPFDDRTDMYLTGHLIFKELVWRSFLQDVKKTEWGNTLCKMHDLMHDLAYSLMSHETFILKFRNVPKIPKTLHHLGLYWKFSSDNSIIELPVDDSLRSIICHFSSLEGFCSFISKQKYLRALDFSYCGVENLPNLVWKLEHLRYLVLPCFHLKKLPESLTRMQNLQTLKLAYTSSLLELPKDMRMMKNLWFLVIYEFDSLLCTPPRLGELIFLRKLSIFIVGVDAYQRIDQLKELNLEGKLTIKGLENVRDLEDAKSANLMTKNNLISLSLSWSKGIGENSAEHYEEVLQGLQPPQSLEKIHIESYQGSRFPKWASLAFKNLNKITLKQCKRCEHLPPWGKLPSLTHLELCGLDYFKRLDIEWPCDGESPFPALTNLSISYMPNFEEWTTMDFAEGFPSLQELKIEQCPKLTGLPKLPTLKSLEIHDGNVALLRSITFLTALTSLELYGIVEELDVFPEGLLQNHKSLEFLRIWNFPIQTLSNTLYNLSLLKTLAIGNCSNLESLDDGLKDLNSLRTLDIYDCDGLISFPANILDGLPSLTSLCFRTCKKLKQPLSGGLLRPTPPLQSLELGEFREMEGLPESLQLLNNLGMLRLLYCDGLHSLPNWLSSLEALSRLDIWECQNLNSLPDVFNNMKSLRELRIYKCPQLEKSCRKPDGEDWPKISHIPIVSIQN